MTVQISKAEMEATARTSEGLGSRLEGIGNKINGLPDPGLDGWQTAAAMTEVNEHWRDKTRHAAGQWNYFASAVWETSKAITGTDEEVAFNFPKPGKGETDIPGLKDTESRRPLPAPGERGEEKPNQGIPNWN